MIVQEQVSLKQYNTFGFEAKAQFFIEVTSEAEVIEICQSDFLKDKTHFVLGGGSNILFTKDFDGVIIRNNIQRLNFEKSGQLIRATCGSGLNWHELVIKSLDNGANGLENLSLIPGTVGASPIQNIGAYGVELKDVFQSLRAVEIKTGKVKKFTKDECLFDYRLSVFKTDLKGKYMITEVTLNLHNSSRVNTSYGALKSALNEKNVTNPTSKDISNTVIAVRQNKLPDPAKLGNAGSFFKNPVIDILHFVDLQSKYNGIPNFPQPDNKVKVPAAWLIEQSGWKGKKVGNVGVNPTQALVLINYGNGTGREIKELSEAIQKSVSSKFKIQLEAEVNIL